MTQTEWRTWKWRWQVFKKTLPYAFRALVAGGGVAALAYWVIVERGVYLSRMELCLWTGVLAWLAVEWNLYRQAQPQKLEFSYDEQAGYWTYELREYVRNPFSPTTTRICIATRMEKDEVPEPERAFGMQVVGKIHCIVDDKFYVWQETFPWAKFEGGVRLHPNVK